MAEETECENRHFFKLCVTWSWPWPRMTLKVISSWMFHQP